ncbi:lycopene cyclase domain-containing protein [Candidatus Roizmanbacteria bacterium]|nr:lycopene cyclase domain-containing protein [Candidatus Roizmanbacteria bacterium]
MLSYPLWLFLFCVLPIVVVCLLEFKTIKKYKKVIALAITGSIIFSFPWDFIAIHEKIWYFTKPHIVGIWLGGLPIEEWFFITLETVLFTTVTIVLWEKYQN